MRIEIPLKTVFVFLQKKSYIAESEMQGLPYACVLFPKNHFNILLWGHFPIPDTRPTSTLMSWLGNS